MRQSAISVTLRGDTLYPLQNHCTANGPGPFAVRGLLEVAVEETLEAGAVTGFVLGHLVNRVVDCVIAEFLGALGDLELGGASALFRVGW